MQKKIKIYYLVFLILLPGIALAQAPSGIFSETKILPGQDTLLQIRRHGDWWFGLTGGFNGNMFFGNYKLPKSSTRMMDNYVDSALVKFPTGWGLGYYIGLSGEWIPVGEKWGASLQIFLFDYKYSANETDPGTNSLNTHYKSKSNFKYISISPSARYYLPWDGWHLYGGFDVDYLFDNTVQAVKEFEYSADISHWSDRLSSNIKLRLGAHIGIGKEFLVADINHKFRVLFSPYILFYGGTNVYDRYGSSQNTAFARLGLTVKFGKDRIDYDTLFYNPDYQEQPVYLASLISRIKIETFHPYIPTIAKLQRIERPVVVAEVTAKPKSDEDAMIGIETKKPKASPITKPINPNVPVVLTYKGSDYKLNEDMKSQLDKLAQYYKSHPGIQIRIMGHTDSKVRKGVQNPGDYLTLRSQNGAKEAKKYLEDKIGKGKLDVIYAGGVGDTEPLKGISNKFDPRQNRLEIQIIGK